MYLTHAVALSCQSFYAWRIYRFGGWVAIPATILFVRMRTTASTFVKNTHNIQLSLAQCVTAYSLGVQVRFLFFGMAHAPSTNSQRSHST
jgi:hypothetical protein